MKLKILAATVFCALLCNGANADAITGIYQESIVPYKVKLEITYL